VLGALIIQTLTTTVYTAGITPESTLVFKALVVIAVCLLQSSRFRAGFRRRRSPRSPRPTVVPEKPASATSSPSPEPTTMGVT